MSCFCFSLLICFKTSNIGSWHSLTTTFNLYDFQLIKCPFHEWKYVITEKWIRSVSMTWSICVLQNCLLLLLSSFWWNHDQCLSMVILKKSSHSVSPIKWRTFAMSLRQQFHWGVIMATGISKMTKFKQWLCYLHAKFMGSFSRMI